MALFILSTIETSPVNLVDDDVLAVTTTGALWATNAAVSTVTNSAANLAVSVAGTIGSLFDEAINFATGVNEVTINVATTGVLEAIDDEAVRISVDQRSYVWNAGTITGKSGGISLLTSDTGASHTLRNIGTIMTQGDSAVIMQVGNGLGILANSGSLIAGEGSSAPTVDLAGTVGAAFDVTNAGTITAGAAGTALAVDIATLRLVNTGTIIGNIAAPVVNALITNSGLIAGNVTFGAFGGTFTNTGGTLTGTLNGGTGATTIRTDRNIDVFEATNGGNDTYITSQTHTDLAANIETLILRAGAVSGTGNSLANTVVGTGAANMLGGGGANDTIAGLGGADMLEGNIGEDRLTGGEGNDTLFGNQQNDILFGEEGADRLVGGAGDDDLTGGDDEDTMFGGAGNDRLTASADSDLFFGGAGNDTLTGSSANDSMSGGDGQDVLQGGAGRDVMTGGLDADRFVFTAVADSPSTRSNTPNPFDLIADYQRGLDKIDLSFIDANGALAGNTAFVFIGARAFTKPGEIQVLPGAGDSLEININTIGTTEAEMTFIVNTNAPELRATDFIL